MQIEVSKFDCWITPQDLVRIHAGLRSSGIAEGDRRFFYGADIHKFFEAWEQFVTADWDSWDVAEYDNDLLCRYQIQVAIELSTPETQARLEQAVQPLDHQFKAAMKPSLRVKRTTQPPLARHPYFWEQFTIHPGSAPA